MQAMKFVSAEKNVGEILLAQGYITEDIYRKLIAFMQKGDAQPANPPQARSVEAVPVKRTIEEYPPINIDAEQQSRKEILPENFIGTTGIGNLNVSIPRSLQTSNSLEEIFCFARKMNASDIHLCPGTPIMFRQFGSLVKVTDQVLEQRQIENLIRSTFRSELVEKFLDQGDIEFIHTIEGGGRYRVTLMRENFGFDLTARVVPMKIMSYEESGLPEICKGLTKWAQGMVLVTGPIGSGKTSTLAVLIELINQTKDDHIITIEAPVEMVFQPRRCQITQRELELHTLSQDNALRAALRQDPDIIMISELRDLTSIQLAVSAAETGHLVLATMNTANAMRTIYRLIDSFPPEEQGIIRNMVSLSLRGIISQQLIPRKDGSGVVPAFEVLLITTAISNLIRKNNSHLIESAMVTGKSAGMVLLDDSLETLYQQGMILGKEAYYRCINPKRFLAIKDK